MCNREEHEAGPDDGRDDGPTRGALAVAGMVTDLWRERFDHFLDHLGVLIPPVLAADREILFAMYCNGRVDAYDDILGNVNLFHDAAGVLLARALARVTSDAGLSVTDLEAARRAHQQRRGDDHANRH